MKYIILGGTGSIGRIYADYLKSEDVTIFSRNEYQQWLMKKEYPNFNYVLGDIQNLGDLKKAVKDKDILIHLAAIKHVSSAEENPQKAIDINVTGTKNVIEAVLDSSVYKAIYMNTDKSIKPINTYGASKFLAFQLWEDANKQRPIFSTIVSCNIWGASGSVIQIYEELLRDGKKSLPISDMKVERYFTPKFELTSGFEFIKRSIEPIIYNTSVSRMYLKDIVEAYMSKPEIKGLSPGEKLKENYVFDNDFDMEPCSVEKIREWIVTNGK